MDASTGGISLLLLLQLLLLMLPMLILLHLLQLRWPPLALVIFLALATAIDMATYIAATLTFLGALADEHGHREGAHGDIMCDALKHDAHLSHEVPIDVAWVFRDHVSLQSR